jgi:hypothetical protein
MALGKGTGRPGLRPRGYLVKELTLASTRILDSLFATTLFLVFGLLNAESWAALISFIAVGGVFDAIKNAGRFQKLINKPSHFGVWFTCVQLAFAAGAVLAFGLSRLALSTPSEAHDLAQQAYSLSAPWIRLLRTQYHELIAHGYDLRAEQIAIYYPLLFALFYLSLGVQAVQFHRCYRPLRVSASPIQAIVTAFRARPVLMTFVFPVLIASSVFLIYKVTAAGVEWNERGGKWRWDLHQSDGVLFNYIVIMPLISGIIVFLQFCVRSRIPSVAEAHSD